MKKFKVEYIDENTILFNYEEYLHPIEGQDNSRLVFIGREYVIKCDNWTEIGKQNYWKQSRKEWLNYHKFKLTEYKDYFVPVLQAGKINNHWYVIQPRVAIVRAISDENIEKMARKISRELGLFDIYSHNYTMINDEILIYDYAC